MTVNSYGTLQLHFNLVFIASKWFLPYVHNVGSYDFQFCTPSCIFKPSFVLHLSKEACGSLNQCSIFFPFTSCTFTLLFHFVIPVFTGSLPRAFVVQRLTFSENNYHPKCPITTIAVNTEAGAEAAVATTTVMTTAVNKAATVAASAAMIETTTVVAVVETMNAARKEATVVEIGVRSMVVAGVKKKVVDMVEMTGAMVIVLVVGMVEAEAEGVMEGTIDVTTDAMTGVMIVRVVDMAGALEDTAETTDVKMTDVMTIARAEAMVEVPEDTEATIDVMTGVMMTAQAEDTVEALGDMGATTGVKMIGATKIARQADTVGTVELIVVPQKAQVAMEAVQVNNPPAHPTLEAASAAQTTFLALLNMLSPTPASQAIPTSSAWPLVCSLAIKTS